MRWLDAQEQGQNSRTPQAREASEPDVKTLSLVDSASRRVASMILDGTLRAGDRLPPERELASQFMVSRTVIREAIRVLATKGLVEVRQGKGARVRKQNADSD